MEYYNRKSSLKECQYSFNVVSEGMRCGEFKKSISEEEITDYIRVYIEGLIKVSVMEKCYKVNSGRYVETEKMIIYYYR
ncbi:MAG TPA: hypothetical protein DG753_03235 [Clostridium sp.]|nr:hypothetical protein [Clostridium sp.]